MGFARQNFSVKNLGGFTLIEILVALSIFTMAILLAVGMLNQTIKSQRKVFANQEVIDNTRFALETISKTARMAKFQTSSDGSILNLQHPTKGGVIYDLDSGRIRENGIAITSGKIRIERFWFDVSGMTPDDNLQPKITVIIKGKDLNNQAEINLQTTISQRELDI